MTITTGKTDPMHGALRWANVDADPQANYPPGYDNPDLQQLPIGIFEALGELSEGTSCDIPDCEHIVGPELRENEDGIPTSSQWHDVTFILRHPLIATDAPNPVKLCEECGYVALFAITGKAPW